MTFNNWATNLSKGSPNENSQTLTFELQRLADSFTEFNQNPTLDASGNLQVTVSPEALQAEGVVKYSVTLKDNGGTANGGVDTSDAILLTIRVIRPPQPVILSLLPDHVTVMQTAQVVLIGEDFGDGTDVTQVLLCDIEATIVDQSDTQVTVTATAASDVCTGTVTVTTKSGYTVQALTFKYIAGNITHVVYLAICQYTHVNS